MDVGIFVQNKRFKYRRFDYEPRFYDPAKDERLKRRMHIKSQTHVRRRNPLGLIIFGLLCAVVVYMYLSIG